MVHAIDAWFYLSTEGALQARQQVYANFHMKEDWLLAINVLATHWRNQRKTFVRKTKEFALVEKVREGLSDFSLLHTHAQAYRNNCSSSCS